MMNAMVFHALDHPPSRFPSISLSPLAGKTSSHVLNSKHFAQTMRDITLAEDEVVVSFNMPSLFTNVPIGEVVEVIQDKLRKDDTCSLLVERTPLSLDRVAELLDMWLRSTTMYLLQLR